MATSCTLARGAASLIGMDLAAEIEAAERAVWAALVAGDAAADEALLSPDFLGAYPDGFANRAAHAAQLVGGPSVETYSLSDITVRALGPHHALIAYRADYTRPGMAAAAMLIGSIWRRDATGWVNVYSQDTPLG